MVETSSSTVSNSITSSTDVTSSSSLSSVVYYTPSQTTTPVTSSSGSISLVGSSSSSTKLVGSTPSSNTLQTSLYSTATTSATISAGASSQGNDSSTATGAGNVSTGAAVGIGLGCAIAGALLAGLIALLLLRKRQRSAHLQQPLPSNRGAYDDQEKHRVTATSAPVPSGGVTNVDRLLPQPTEDNEIIGALSKIRDDVKNHAQNYYHNAPVRHDEVDEARLQELAVATAISTSAIRNLLLNPATRVYAIRLYLAQLILSRCTGRSDGLSFLPSEISGLATISSGEEGTTASQAALFSKWKTISGVLLRQHYGQAPDDNDSRAGNVAQALSATEPILRPFVSPNADRNARRRNLEAIMREAANLAFVLFSQPAAYRFDYTRPAADSLVVFPALLSPPRVLSAKETERISGLSG